MHPPEGGDRRRRLVILGAGFGGLHAARAAAATDGGWTRASPWTNAAAPVEVVLVDRSDRFVFKPLLYELLSYEVDEADIAPTLDSVLPTAVRRVRASVQGVDPARREVALCDAAGAALDPIPYDALIVALGSEPLTYGIRGVAEHTFSAATLAGFLRLRAHLEEVLDRPQARGQGVEAERLRTVVVVGAGASGVETALKLADTVRRKGQPVRIVVVEIASTILPGFSDKLRQRALDALREKGVELRLDTGLLEANAYGLVLRPRPASAPQDPRAHAAPPERLLAATVVWTAGMQPVQAVREMRALPHDRFGRLRVGATLEVEERVGIFAIGDAAQGSDAAGRAIPSTAQAAMQQASVAAANALARLDGQPLAPFTYRHLGESLSLGIGADVVQAGPLVLEGRLGTLCRRALYLARMPGALHRVEVGARWAARLFRAG